jgi:hypothetical protein
VPLRFTDVQLSGGNVVLTFRTPNTAAIHRIDEKTNITDITWAEVPSVTFTNPAGKVLTATFAQPMGGQRFYRARLVP